MKSLRRFAAVIAVAALAVAGPAAADDLDDELAQVEAEIEDLLAQIDEASSERSGLAFDVRTTQAAVDRLRGRLIAAEQALEDSTWQRNLTQLELDRARAAVAEARVGLAEATEAVAVGRTKAQAAVRRLYTQSGQETPTVVLEAASLDEVAVVTTYLGRVSDHRAQAVDELARLLTVAESHRRLVDQQQAAVDEQAALLEFIDTQRAAYAEEIAEQTELVAALLADQRALLAAVDDDIAFFEGELAGLEQEQEAIEALIAAETAPPEDDPPPSDDSTVQYYRPVPGAITSPFGPRLHPILGYTRMHSGVDMRAPQGQAIRALTGGRIILASSNGGYGNTVIIDHGGGLTSLYAHQSSFNVRYGDVVEGGDVVGYAGSSGLATGPHLHFEVRINGSPVDPAPYLAGT
ncbi:MAG: peptidoglycan DD-metalloendopeptidase family protein [Acidimicrobiia bacterium]|nr:peptidoglycan DD-metalloendopeptidase family protein [Acidimicrobiia bacterium]